MFKLLAIHFTSGQELYEQFANETRYGLAQ